MPKPLYADAIALLKADHRKVEQLFASFSKARDETRKQQLARQICTELKIHTMIEEEIFYPAFRGQIDDSILDEAYVEHDGAKVLINDIEQSEADERYYDAKVKVLCEDIKHHVHEEEARVTGMFAACRATTVDLEELRDRMLRRRKELKMQALDRGLAAVPPSVVRLVHV